MLSDVHVIELLPAYALGSLDEEEARQVVEHLATCQACCAELRVYEAVTSQLALAAPDALPPAGMKGRLMEGIQARQARPVIEGAAGAREPWWQRLAGLFQQGAPAWGMASLVLVALLILSNVWWWQRNNRQEGTASPGGMQVVALAGTDTAPQATGTLVISEDGEYGTLVVDGLPALDEAHQYQLWLIRDGQRTSGGVFSVNAEGYGSLWISSPEPLLSYPAFGITIEPAGGSPGPSGDKVLGTSL